MNDELKSLGLYFVFIVPRLSFLCCGDEYSLSLIFKVSRSCSGHWPTLRSG